MEAGKDAELTVVQQTSNSSGETSYDIDMTKIIMGTFDSASGTLVLSTPVTSTADEIL